MSRVSTAIGEGATMTRVTILREGAGADEATYRAVGGSVQAAGRTAGEAVDALAARLPEGEGGTLLIVRDLQPDPFFTAEQRRRLEELMDRWRAARDAGGELPAEDRDELRILADAEVEATALRADEAWRELSR
jgi:hypothetical protein